MAAFVHEDSIVRRIWGEADTILFIFAGASAEFALNKAVDWLYFTGRLPADPIGRLFSTVTYAQRIVFEEEEQAQAAIRSIAAIHKGVEEKRGMSMPAEAYLDVLFMLIDYSIRAFELLHRPMTPAEKGEVFEVFYRVGEGMGLSGLPADFGQYEQMRERHLQENLLHSDFTLHLYARYRESLGELRYGLLLYVQVLLTPARVRRLLGLSALQSRNGAGQVEQAGKRPGDLAGNRSAGYSEQVESIVKRPGDLAGNRSSERARFWRPYIAGIWIYRGLCFIGLSQWLKKLLVPREYRAQVFVLDTRTA